ncbi:MAG: CRTAC1 family protein [Alphaproteobacteria bacterium]|nr:CRTAC1 family protein [Alphaproteobacteria bacterium]
MRTTAAAAILLIATGNAWAGTCPAPKFTVSDVIVGDGSLDRGFPGGISLVDVDGDGDIDLMATHGFDPTANKYVPDRSMLYLNDGQGHFTHALDSTLSSTIGPTSGSTWGDVDGDGDLDAFVGTEIGALDVFYRNLGHGRFERQELGDATKTKGSNFTAAWADIDGDGDLDLYVGGPTLEPPAKALVYRNDAGTFKRVTNTPLENGDSNPGAALWSDLDNDGDVDLLLANSDIARQSNLPPAAIEHTIIYRNNGNWNFEASTGNDFQTPAFPATSAALGDVDNDGDLDLLLGLYAGDKATKRDRLFLNDGRAHFTESRGLMLPEHDQMQFAVAMADFNLDGNLDLVAASYNAPVLVYAGDGKGRFTPAADAGLAMRKRAHSSIATGDVNGDGRQDVVIGSWAETAKGEPMTLLLNETPSCGAWSEITLKDEHRTPNPPGARVTLVTKRTDGSERRQLRESSAQSGLRGQSASTFLFGIPTGEVLSSAEIRWPDGKTQSATALKPNAKQIIERR